MLLGRVARGEQYVSAGVATVQYFSAPEHGGRLVIGRHRRSTSEVAIAPSRTRPSRGSGNVLFGRVDR
ncbi:hypothetical protein [Pseudonocardia zijingensis]|uniref:hypothetical protein n=1 Tax=Pseudonocardia zijingensis TaxID=153376 RepID=UPI0031E25E3E